MLYMKKYTVVAYLVSAPTFHILPVQLVSRALVPARVLEQVLLMVVLRVPPCPCCDDIRHDLCPDRVEMLLLHLFGHTARDRLLLGGMEEDGRAVFCSTGVNEVVNTRQD